MPYGAGLGKRIDLTDLRYGAPEEGLFHALAETNVQGQVLVSAFSFDNGTLIGFGQP